MLKAIDFSVGEEEEDSDVEELEDIEELMSDVIVGEEVIEDLDYLD